MSFVSKPWRQEMQRCAAEQDRAFGETFTLFPMCRPPNMSANRDRSRSVQTIVAIFSDEGEMAGLDTFRPKILTSNPQISVARNQLTWTPKSGDIFKRCCNGLQYEVKSELYDDVSRVVFELFQMGVPKR